MYINCTATFVNTSFLCTLLFFLSPSSKEAEFGKYFILSTYLQKYFLQDNRKHTTSFNLFIASIIFLLTDLFLWDSAKSKLMIFFSSQGKNCGGNVMA